MFYLLVMYLAVGAGLAFDSLPMVVAGVGLLLVDNLRPRGRHE